MKSMIGLVFATLTLTAGYAADVTDRELNDALQACGRHSIYKDPKTGNIVQEDGWENCQVLRDEVKRRQELKKQRDQTDLQDEKPKIDDLANKLKSAR